MKSFRMANTPAPAAAIAQMLLVVAGIAVAVKAPLVGVPLALVWLLPIVVSIHLGVSRDRTGLLWGFFLGWLGVFILALMRAQPKLEPQPVRQPAKPWER